MTRSKNFHTNQNNDKRIIEIIKNGYYIVAHEAYATKHVALV